MSVVSRFAGLHGFRDFWYTWPEQMDGVAGDGYRVAAIDLRGYNRNDQPSEVDWLDSDLTLVTVPGAGHFVQQDAAELVTRSRVAWLGR